MGSASIRPLTPIFALLNVSLGYWLFNPRYASNATGGRRVGRGGKYFWLKMTGRLTESSEAVYLTDGGHIENLGVYELLRRRCKVIFVVDAEADARMSFSSLMTLQRYARIDLGIRIDLPWWVIQKRTLEVRNHAKSNPLAPPGQPLAVTGPHVAIGTIDYGNDQRGYIVYIKSSLTGDENDYVRDYARRNEDFPHERTSNQFYSEEQFEVYRALGFHIANGFLSGEHVIVTGPSVAPIDAHFSSAGVEEIKEVRTALGLVTQEAVSVVD